MYIHTYVYIYIYIIIVRYVDAYAAMPPPGRWTRRSQPGRFACYRRAHVYALVRICGIRYVAYT